MLGHLSNPLNSAVLHRSIRIQALSDSFGDDGRAESLKVFQLLALFCHEGVNLAGLLVQIGGNGFLLGKWRKEEKEFFYF